MAHLANFCHKFKFKVSKYAFFMNAISFFKSLMHLEAIQSQKKSDFRAIFEDSIFSKFAQKYIAEDASKVECLDFLFFLTLFPIYLSVGS